MKVWVLIAVNFKSKEILAEVYKTPEKAVEELHNAIKYGGEFDDDLKVLCDLGDLNNWDVDRIEDGHEYAYALKGADYRLTAREVNLKND